MKYRLSLLPQAESDVDSIVGYLVERSPQGAAAWLGSWKKLLSTLSERPQQYGLAPESAEHDAEVRHALFKTRRGRTYRALFVIVADTVHVLHVRGPGQDFVQPNELRLP